MSYAHQNAVQQERGYCSTSVHPVTSVHCSLLSVDQFTLMSEYSILEYSSATFIRINVMWRMGELAYALSKV